MNLNEYLLSSCSFHLILLCACRGNIIKLDGEGKVCLAYHGTKRLTPEQIKQIYYAVDGESVSPAVLEYGTFHEKDYHAITTFFSTAYGWLFAVLVDLEDEKGVD